MTLAATLAAVLAPTTAHATFPGANGKIAFALPGGACPRIYTMDFDGSNRTLVIQGAHRPRWSPDGTKIAYSNCGSVLVSNADGTNPIRLEAHHGDLAVNEGWSPAETELAQVEETLNAGEPPSFFITRPGYPSGYNTSPFVSGDNPDWSPDGSRIAYDDGAGTYTVPPGGGASTFTVSGVDPSWSPNASKIAYADGGDIWFANADGSGPTRLATRGGVNEFLAHPVWSPDGQKIVFSRLRQNPDGSDTCSIDVMHADGSGISPIASGGSGTNDCPTEPDWQPIPIDTYVRPRGATPMRISLVPANQPCTSPNSTHGAPLAYPSCAPPQLTSTQLTTGTPDSNGLPVRMQSFMALNALAGDLKVDANVNQVFYKNLTPYTGSLRAELPVRITDRDNTPRPGGPGAGTSEPFLYGFDIPCIPDPDPQLGSDCSLSTTADTLVPGTLAAGLRAIWQVGRARVDDSGADGNPDTTADNSPFVVEGVFVP